MHIFREEDQLCGVWFSPQSCLVHQQAGQRWTPAITRTHGVQSADLHCHSNAAQPPHTPPPLL